MALPGSSTSLPGYGDGQEILLVDEVDVFFGGNFYGQTHNQVAVLALPEVEALLREIWKSLEGIHCVVAEVPRLFRHGDLRDVPDVHGLARVLADGPRLHLDWQPDRV